MAEPYLGQIILFAGNYAPQGWAFCNGQSLSINQNAALYSLLGTTYGDDGVSTFLLPNLQSRVSIGAGQGAGLSNYPLGSTGGSESITLNTQQIPAHNHMVNVDASVGSQTAPNGNNLAEPSAGGRPPRRLPATRRARRPAPRSSAPIPWRIRAEARATRTGNPISP